MVDVGRWLVWKVWNSGWLGKWLFEVGCGWFGERVGKWLWLVWELRWSWLVWDGDWLSGVA